MPLYEYECKQCGARFEKMQPVTADPLTECVECAGGPVRRVIHPVGVIFKGSGWYITDSRKSTSSSKSGGEKSDGDSAKTETSAEKTSSESGEKSSTAANKEAG